jgi:hypothetical protein
VRDYADKLGISAEEGLSHGLKQKADEFNSAGGEIYLKSDAS